MLSDIRYILWDLDGTLYRFEEDFIKACNLAAAKAAIHLGAPFEVDEAINFAWKSYAQTGQSIVNFLKQYGIKPADMHECYHGLIDEKIIRITEQVSERLNAATQDLELSNVIITHSSREWASPVLNHLGLDHVFPDDRIIAKEDYNFES